MTIFNIIFVLTTILFYFIGMLFFYALSDLSFNRTKDFLKIIFYPITMWFIK